MFKVREIQKVNDDRISFFIPSRRALKKRIRAILNFIFQFIQGEFLNFLEKSIMWFRTI